MVDESHSTILVTGGSGSFGRAFVERALEGIRPARLIVFSRDELKQHEMREQFRSTDDTELLYMIGDVRDREALYRVFDGVDTIVHAAALKQVPACEYYPYEAVLTNVVGAQNIVDAAIARGVGRVLAISTDKAVSPANLYGATKLCSEKLFVRGNAYVGQRDTRLSCVRYGNVVGSRGSVVPLLRTQRENGKITITDRRMTRFWITLDQAVEFVTLCLSCMHGGEIFIPKIPSMNVMDLAEAVAPGSEVEYIGIRPGEKLHEILISEDEARHTVELDEFFVIVPEATEAYVAPNRWEHGRSLEDGYSYNSENNPVWLTQEELRAMVG